ncbi:MAG: RsmE family RNA methyltransferase [Candidatus Sericytochromatia bacterium]
MAKHIPHIFINKNNLESFEIIDDDFAHLTRVLRFKVGDKFIILDNQGLKANCIIESISKNKLNFNIIDKEIYNNDNLKLHLIQAITKIETFEEILDKSTQLGISTITPVITENVNTSIDIFNKKIIRFNKIIKSASEQSQRIFLPELKPIIKLNDFYNNFDSDNTFIAYEKATKPFKDCLNNYNKNEINVLCGTEGGFTQKEFEILSKKFKTFSLGKNILRAETAVISIISNINFALI